MKPPTGHVFRVERARGPAWYTKYRLPDGRQVQKKLGPAWTLLIGQLHVWWCSMTLGRASAPTQVPNSADGRRLSKQRQQRWLIDTTRDSRSDRGAA